jgi:hypothetical protein
MLRVLLQNPDHLAWMMEPASIQAKQTPHALPPGLSRRCNLRDGIDPRSILHSMEFIQPRNFPLRT